MYLVTGGAGFIGSNVVAALCAAGERVVVCDTFGSDDKWRNLRAHNVWEFVFPEDLAGWLSKHAHALSGVVHMGAVSATTERDVDLIIRSNPQFSTLLWDVCTRHGVPYIYASSAATYGDGSHGFVDEFDAGYFAQLKPLNPYGWSKHIFDRRVLRCVEDQEAQPPKWAGLKFFNVYGPNEYHKGSMQSVVATHFPRIAAGEPLRLFKSDRPEYEDGGQMRDFIYVRDCVDVILWMLKSPFPSSVYNVGTGQARTWVDLGRAMFSAGGLTEAIEFIDMPTHLQGKYQYFTQADMSKLAAAGYNQPFTSLEDGVRDYVQTFLASDDLYR